jgi:ribonuclease BN (tRNA processing enzyme)
MNGDNHTLEELAKNSNILVAHNAIPKGTKGVAANLHMTPLTIGEIAGKAKVKFLVLSHRMIRTLGREVETKKEIRKNYKGRVKFANDRSYYKVK